MSDANPTDLKPPVLRRIPRWLLWLILTPAICGGLCGLSYWLVELRPQYVEVPLPPIGSYFVVEETTANIYGSRYFFRRVSTDCSGCDSWQALWERYDTLLIADGWVQAEGEVCRVLPESDFLPYGENGYVSYRRKEIIDSIGFCDGPTVCLAIYPTTDYSSGYQITIGTENPSFITEYGHCVG